MNKSIQYSLIAFVAIFFIASGFLFYVQQKAISDLKRQISQDTKTSTNSALIPPFSLPNATSTNYFSNSDQKIETLKSLIPKINDIGGEIKERSDNSLIIEAKIADLSKSDQFYTTKSGAIPTLIKKYKVVVDKNTDFSFSLKKMNELKVGDWVRAFSKEPIYNTMEFIATSVSYLTEEDIKMIGGK